MSGSAKTDPAEAAHPGGVLGVGLGLLVILGGILALASGAFGGGPPDFDALLAEIMPAPRPFELALEEGTKLHSGEQMLRLRPRGDAEAEVEEVVLTIARSAQDVERLLQHDFGEAKESAGQVARWEDDPSFDHVAELLRGEVRWGGWRAPFVRKRALKETGSWSEAIAVNLTTRDRALLMTVIWPPEVEASEETLGRVLDGVVVPAIDE